MSYLDPDNAVADRIRTRRGGPLRPLDQALMHSPPIASGWNDFIGALRTDTTLPAALRELVILRIAVVNRAEYEWIAHEPVARQVGVTEDLLGAVKAAKLTDSLPARELAVLRFTDAVTRDIDVTTAAFDSLGEWLDERQVVELTLTVAAYNMVSRFLVALRVGEPAIPANVEAW